MVQNTISICSTSKTAVEFIFLYNLVLLASISPLPLIFNGVLIIYLFIYFS